MSSSQDRLAALKDALDRTGALVEGIPADAPHGPTPCASFDVQQLVEHIVRDLVMFTSTASGEASGPVPEQRAPTAADYRGAADALVAAWREGGVEGRTLHTRMGDVPATWALGQHLSDVIVHGWDVAKATGQRASFDERATLDSLEWAGENLRPEFRGDEGSGRSFGPEVGVSGDAPPLDRLVAFFGRDPDWPSSS